MKYGRIFLQIYLELGEGIVLGFSIFLPRRPIVSRHASGELPAKPDLELRLGTRRKGVSQLVSRTLLTFVKRIESCVLLFLQSIRVERSDSETRSACDEGDEGTKTYAFPRSKSDVLRTIFVVSTLISRLETRLRTWRKAVLVAYVLDLDKTLKS